MEETIWTRENVVGKVFPCEDQGGRGITVAMVSGVVIWLHCGRSKQPSIPFRRGGPAL
jgi:hypothetical protein